MPAITWTKDWSSADDGTVVSGADLKNIQDDIGSGLTQDATSIQGIDVEAPVAGDDDSVLFYDHSNLKFDYVTRATILATTAPTVDIDGGTINGITSFGMTTVTGITDILDEDTMASDSDTALATQQSIKAYVDNFGGKEVFTSNGTFTVPTGITRIKLTMVGGGGGGGGGYNDNAAGGGGGAGVIENWWYPVTPAAELAVVIGAGGTGGPSNQTGAAGESTTFNTVIIAPGGSGGIGQAAGGAGGAGGVASGIPPTAATGNTGKSPLPEVYAGGAGQSTGGTDNVGGGGGAPRILGVGGNGGTFGAPSSPQPGADGTGYGGGGGGGSWGNSGGNQGSAGGAGAPGICIVEW